MVHHYSHSLAHILSSFASQSLNSYFLGKISTLDKIHPSIYFMPVPEQLSVPGENSFVDFLHLNAGLKIKNEHITFHCTLSHCSFYSFFFLTLTILPHFQFTFCVVIKEGNSWKLFSYSALPLCQHLWSNSPAISAIQWMKCLRLYQKLSLPLGPGSHLL